jgi:hypothetical protein
MAKIAKLQESETRERDLWKAIIRYANGASNVQSSAQLKDFEALISVGFEWISKPGDFCGEDVTSICQDVKDGTALEILAERYWLDFRNMLGWLIAPDMWFYVSDEGKYAFQEFAAKAGEFLDHHAMNIRMSVIANTEFIPRSANPEDRTLIGVLPEQCVSVLSPVCKFVVDQIIRHDKGGEELRKVIPIGYCRKPGCDRFFMIERVGRGRFCSASCRAQKYQSGMTKEEKAARMRAYRSRLKEMANKPIRIAKKTGMKRTKGRVK